MAKGLLGYCSLDGLQGKTLIRVLPLALLILGSVWIIVAITAREQYRDSAKKTLDQRVDATALLFANHVSAAGKAARSAANNSITVGALIGQDLERVVRPFLASYTIMGYEAHEATIVDFAGNVIISNNATSTRSFDFGPKNWLDNVLSGQELFWIRGASLYLVFPIRLGDTPEGALVFRLDSQRLVPNSATTRDLGSMYLSRVIDFRQSTTQTELTAKPGELVKSVTKSIPSMPGLGVEVSQRLPLTSPWDDSVQQFLTMVFAGIFALSMFGTYLTTRLVTHPVQKLINRIEDHGIDIGSVDTRAPREVRILAERFRDAARDVEEALIQERQLSAQQRRFVAMISHEFRTPLAIIDGAAGSVKRRRDRMTPNKIDGRLTQIQRAVNRLIRLIESTLTASKLEAGKIKLKIVPFDVKDLIEQIVQEREAISGHASITVAPGGLPETVPADGRLLYNVLDNLISNAIKYGGDDPVVTIKPHYNADYVFVSVTDTGVGVPPDEIDRLGEPYFRASTSAGIPGTGIGINTVKLVASLHGGELTVVSKQDEGSTFTVSLSRHTEIPEANSEDKPQAMAAE